MKSLLVLAVAVLLSVSVIAQNDDDAKTIKKVNDPQPVEFTIKKANSNTFLDTKLTTIQPSTKIINSELKLQPAKAVDKEKLKIKSEAIKKD